MTRVGAVVVRRFVERVNRADHVTEVRRAVELAIPPVPGMVLAFTDGTPDATVSIVRHRVGAGPALGVIPCEVELRCTKEPIAGLEAALAAGWAEPPTPPAAAETVSAKERSV